MEGSPSTSTPFQVTPPMYAPGHGFSEAFFSQILPGLLRQGYPEYPGELDPGLSPTAAAAMRAGQNYAVSPYSNMFGAAAGNIGKFMNPNYEDPRGAQAPGPDYGFGGYAPEPTDWTPQVTAASNSMVPPVPAAYGAPGAPAEGVGRATAMSAVGPQSPGSTGGARIPGSHESPGLDPLQPAGPFSRRPSPGTFFGDGDGGGGGGVPGGSNSGNPSVMGGEPGLQMPGGGSMPAWLRNFLITTGLSSAFGGGAEGGGSGGFDFTGDMNRPAVPDLGGSYTPSYQPPQGGQGFVDWNPGSPTINIGPGLQTGSYSFGNPGLYPPGALGPTPGPGGGAPAGPSGGGGTPFDPNAVVTSGRPWFGRWRGPNKGKTMDEVYQDNYERGWDYGPDAVIPEGWAAGGSKPTYGWEVNARLGLGGGGRPAAGGGGGQRRRSGGGGGDVSAPPMPSPPVPEDEVARRRERRRAVR